MVCGFGQFLGEGPAVDFAGAVIDAEAADLAEDAFDDRFSGDTLAAEDLDAAVCGPVDGFAADDLGDAAFGAGAVAFVQQPGGVPDGEAAGADVHVVVGEHEADAFVLGEGLTEGLALGGVGEGDVLGAPGGAEPAHAVGESGRGEADLGVAEALAGFAEDVECGDLEAVEFHDGVAAGEALVEAVHGADDADAGLIHVGEEHGCAAIVEAAGFTRHDDGEAGVYGACDEPFGTIDAISVAGAGGGCGEGGGVGAGAGRWFGHAEAASDFGVGEGVEPAFLLRRGRNLFEEVHVALVWGGDVHGEGAENGIARFLEHHGAGDVGQAEAAVFAADMGGEEPGGAGAGVQVALEVIGGAVGALAWVSLHGDDLVADEGAGAELEVDEFRGEGEVHGVSLECCAVIAPGWVGGEGFD